MSASFPGKIGVVGAGAVGSYYGGMLAHAGEDVHFLLRGDFDAVQANGLTIHTRGETVHLAHVKCSRRPEEIGPCDVVLISLKTTSNAALETLLPPLIGPDTALLTLQNGLGNEEFLAARWGAERVMGALCFVCINRTAPGVIAHLDHGSISLGEFQRPAAPRTSTMAAALRNAGLEAKAVDDLVAERWRKLVWNIPFNGLAIAAGGATVADVLADDDLRALARALMDDVLAAARALGHDIPDAFADFQIQRSYSMGPYKPSSMIDWEAGRPVEVEAIWGEPLKQGLTAGASLPRLETLYRLLRRLTAIRQSG